MTEDQVSKSPVGVGDTVDLEQFRLESPAEVLRILQDLIRGHQLVTAYFNDGREFILTAILHVDPEQNHLVLDYGADEQMNRRLLAHQRALFVTRHNQVRVQFGTEQIVRATYQSLPALVVPIPESLFRIQRREYFRLNAPMGHHLNLSFVAPEGSEINAHIVDISVGGIGIIEPGEDEDCNWGAGTLIANCHIELPEEGTIEADIEIRNRYQTGEQAGLPVYRIGCRLLRLDSRQTAAIQRYIHRVELERRRLFNDD